MCVCMCVCMYVCMYTVYIKGLSSYIFRRVHVCFCLSITLDKFIDYDMVITCHLQLADQWIY